ncbi:hypothetical protein [Endozoicomonas sp. ALC020]|uniref:hypothetical protein n=1 Tax=unclassified Endozoicomonas TaxID=2644528 RepID=UPI003BB107F3
MKKLLKGFIIILTSLGPGFTVANEMDLFEEQNDTDSGQYVYDAEDLYHNETTQYPDPYFESEGEDEAGEERFDEERFDEEKYDDDQYDDDEYSDDSDHDQSVAEQDY